MSSQARQRAFYGALILALLGLLAFGLFTAEDSGAQGGGNPDGPKFAPAYRPAEGKRDTFTIECDLNDPTGETLVLTFQPWNDQNGFFGVDDQRGETSFGPGDYPSGSTFTLANRQGQKLTYWSGVAGEDEQETRQEHPLWWKGEYTYNIVHGRCAEETTPTTSTTLPPDTTPPDTTPDTSPPDTTPTTQPEDITTDESVPPTTFETVPVPPGSAVELSAPAPTPTVAAESTADLTSQSLRRAPTAFAATGISGLEFLIALTIILLGLGAVVLLNVDPKQVKR